MHGPNLIIRAWLKNATLAQTKALAKAARTSVPYLRHVAAGRRDIGVDLAQRLAHASFDMKELRLDQRELCRACARCTLVN